MADDDVKVVACTSLILASVGAATVLKPKPTQGLWVVWDVVSAKDWGSDKKRPHRKRRHLQQIEVEPRYPQSDSATTTSILWPREQNGKIAIQAGIGRVCIKPARTRATKEKMARCSQERLCWHGPDSRRHDSSCPRQRRLETIHSQAAVACPCRSIAKALSQVKWSPTTSPMPTLVTIGSGVLKYRGSNFALFHWLALSSYWYRHFFSKNTK